MFLKCKLFCLLFNTLTSFNFYKVLNLNILKNWIKPKCFCSGYSCSFFLLLGFDYFSLWFGFCQSHFVSCELCGVFISLLIIVPRNQNVVFSTLRHVILICVCVYPYKSQWCLFIYSLGQGCWLFIECIFNWIFLV